MAFQLTAQRFAWNFDREGHDLRGPDRGTEAQLFVRLP